MMRSLFSFSSLRKISQISHSNVKCTSNRPKFEYFQAKNTRFIHSSGNLKLISSFQHENSTKKVEFFDKLDLVLEFHEEGKTKEATNLYEELCEIKPNDLTSYKSRGMLHEMFRHWGSAIADYTKAISLSSSPSASLYAKRGSVFMEMKEFKNAKKDFTKVISIDPKEVDAYFKRASCNMLLEKYDEAVSDLDKTIELDPQHSGAFNLRSLSKYALGSTDSAFDDNAVAFKMDPNQFISYKYRAQMHESKGQLKEALEYWGEAIRFEPNVPSLYVSRAQLFKQMENHAEAVTDLEKAHELDPKDGQISRLLKIFRTELKLIKTEEELTKGIGENSYWEAYYNRGNFYHRSGKKKQALADYEKALASKPTPEIWYKKGHIHFEMEAYEDSVKDLTEAIKMDSNDWKSFSLRGKGLYALNKNEESVKDQSEAIKLCPDAREKAVAYHDRGYAYKSMDKHKEALEDMNEAIKLSPEADHYFGRGNIYFSLNQHDEAIQDFVKAISIESNHWNAYKMRAHSHFKLGQTEKGIEDLTTILESIENPHIYLTRGIAHMGNPSAVDKSIHDMTKAIELDPKLGMPAYQIRGTAYHNIGKYKESIDDLTNAIKISPKERELYEIRSNVHISNNQFQLAIDDLTKAIELHPNNSKLYYQRAHLYDKLGDIAKFAEDYRIGSINKAKKKLQRGVYRK